MARVLANDRQLWVGSSGSGKSTAADYLTAQLACGGCLYDAKGEYQLAEGPTVRTAAQLERELARWKWVRFVPATGEREEAEQVWEVLFRACRRRVVRTTEAYTVSSANWCPRGLRLTQTQGRGFGIGHIAETQRPRNIATELKTEANHIFLMQLGLEAEDLADIARNFAVNVNTVTDELNSLPEYGFLWWDRRTRTLTKCEPFGPQHIEYARRRYARKVF